MKGFLEKINFSRYSMRERLLMLGSYLLAVLVLFNLVFYPKQKEAGRLEERVKTLQSDIQTLSKTLQEYQQKAMTLSKNPASSLKNSFRRRPYIHRVAEGNCHGHSGRCGIRDCSP
jgi:septal ring factor EnvC (AmiA/AmiB activator)